MEKYRKLVKRQRPEKIEQSDDSGLPASMPVQANQPIKPSNAPVGEQALEPIVEVPSSPERWEAIEVYPSNSSTHSLWQQELREIEWEQASDVWESCPYD